MKTNPEINPKERRTFFRNLIGIGAALIAGTAFKAKATTGQKIKLLTADGKLVEVDKSILEKSTPSSATNLEVKNWMKTHTKKSY